LTFVGLSVGIVIHPFGASARLSRSRAPQFLLQFCLGQLQHLQSHAKLREDPAGVFHHPLGAKAARLRSQGALDHKSGFLHGRHVRVQHFAAGAQRLFERSRRAPRGAIAGVGRRRRARFDRGCGEGLVFRHLFSPEC
jgi:hypothetical protein